MNNNEVYDDIYKAIENTTYYKAQVQAENYERSNELNEIEYNFKKLDKTEEIEKLNSSEYKEDLKNHYNSIDKSKVLDEYKETYRNQEELYIYKTENDIYNDNMLSKKYLENTQKLDYLENNMITPTEKYEVQAEVKSELLNEDSRETKKNAIEQEYSYYSEELYNKRVNHEDSEETQDNMLDKMAEKKLYNANDDIIKNNSKAIEYINENEKERLEKKVEQSKDFEKLHSKDMMWKIVKEESLNSEYLNKTDDNMLDARTNASNISTQIANNNRSQYAPKQINRNTSYNNAYQSLDKSKQITNTNYSESRENDSIEEDKKDKRDKGLSR